MFKACASEGSLHFRNFTPKPVKIASSCVWQFLFLVVVVGVVGAVLLITNTKSLLPNHIICLLIPHSRQGTAEQEAEWGLTKATNPIFSTAF